MTSKINQRWIIAGAIWLAALSMSWWNFSTIDNITKTRDTCERLRKEFAFQLRNSDKLHHIEELYQAYYKPVASLKLGFESIRSPLHRLAVLFEMRDVDIHHRMVQATHDQVPFNINMTGDYQKALAFASALVNYPFLSVERSRIALTSSEGMAEIDMELKFQFKIIAPDQQPGAPLQASTFQHEKGVHRQ